jgi:hypothetical protein
MGDFENVTLDMIYKKLQVIEAEVQEINNDLHAVKPEFAERLKKAESGKIYSFKSIDEMKRHLDKKNK